MKIHIKHGRLIDPACDMDWVGDIMIADGNIVAAGNVIESFKPDRTIDASGLVVCPGLIDLSARLREPGFEYKATLESEMKAAVAGGVTSLVCPPDTDPPLDEPGLVEMLQFRAHSLKQARVYPLGALTQGLQGERLTEMAFLHQAGCVAFSQGDAPLSDKQVLLRALDYASTFDFAVWLRPQDASLSRGGVAHDGEQATRLGLPAIPACAETVSLAAILILAKATGARIHLCRISTADGVELVRQAKRSGMAVSCDVAIHHVHLSEMDVGYFNSNCHLIPPLRSLGDRDAIRTGLADGTIDVICSDHAPVDEDAKQVPFGESEPGATALELLLPLTLRWAAQSNLSLSSALARVTSAPAGVLNRPGGSLAVGSPADLCIFDQDRAWLVEPPALYSQGKNTPLANTEVRGQVCYTLVAGKVVFDGGLEKRQLSHQDMSSSRLA